MNRIFQVLEAIQFALITAGVNATLLSSFKPEGTTVNLSFANLAPEDPENMDRIVWEMIVAADIYMIEIDLAAPFEIFNVHAAVHRTILDEATTFAGIDFLHGVWPNDIGEIETSTDVDVAPLTMRATYRVLFHTSYADVEA